MVLNILIAITIALCILLLATFINHRIRSENEKTLRQPLGQLVKVHERNMCVYTDGVGDQTIVFLSGGGTASPVLDFKSLYSQLTDDYCIAVVEKFGYGFSDDHNRSRDIDTILEDTRAALCGVGLQPPYILCPHSMSGLEAIYWSQKYPDEVSAIIGLDMAVPEYYSDMNISTFSLSFNRALCETGLVRLVSNGYINTLYAHSSLSENDKNIIRALYSDRCISDAFMGEARACKDNALTVGEGGLPHVPVLMFISNAEGINLDKDSWVRTAVNYAAQLDDGRYIQLDCPHYLHNFEYMRIAEEMRKFLSTVC